MKSYAFVKANHQATHDGLTGLPNRHLTLTRLEALLARRKRMVGVLFIDLDGFKGINDTLGHGGGDQSLVDAARRMRGALRATDMLGRIGGDEFIALVTPIRSATVATSPSARLIGAFDAPFEVRPHCRATVTASIGIVVRRGSADALLREADEAMYVAKARGKNQFALAGQTGVAA
jgi:diguanylate cyclase (GGDEF)-like protein